MNGQNIFFGGKDYDRLQRKLDRLGDLVHKKAGDGFRLPDDFDPWLGSKEENDVFEKFDAITSELLSRGFEVCISEHFPLKIRYLYAQFVSLVTEGLEVPGTYRMMMDGCCYWCEGCSLSKWCKLREEMDDEESE